MKPSIQHSKSNPVTCGLVFLLLESCLLVIAGTIENQIGIFIILLTSGWLFWTIVEYSVHRFLMHELIVPGKKDELFHHQHHHQNPGDLRVRGTHRIVLVFLGIVIFWLAIYFNNKFTILAGFFIGLLFYSLIHYLLHLPIGKYLFPNVQRAHILHHTRYPRCGYSFSTILWDWLFGTLPPKDVEVTEQMKKNYFNQFNKIPNQKTSLNQS
jgi:sterol desaturase/sphingolipid hydroxylase (fatty acid hydroxylase superfamily)